VTLLAILPQPAASSTTTASSKTSTQLKVLRSLFDEKVMVVVALRREGWQTDAERRAKPAVNWESK